MLPAPEAAKAFGLFSKFRVEILKIFFPCLLISNLHQRTLPVPVPIKGGRFDAPCLLTAWAVHFSIKTLLGSSTLKLLGFTVGVKINLWPFLNEIHSFTTCSYFCHCQLILDLASAVFSSIFPSKVTTDCPNAGYILVLSDFFESKYLIMAGPEYWTACDVSCQTSFQRNTASRIPNLYILIPEQHGFCYNLHLFMLPLWVVNLPQLSPSHLFCLQASK